MCSGSASHERIDLVSILSLCRKLKPAPFCTSYLPLPGGSLGANGWRMCKTEKKGSGLKYTQIP